MVCDPWSNGCDPRSHPSDPGSHPFDPWSHIPRYDPGIACGMKFSREFNFADCRFFVFRRNWIFGDFGQMFLCTLFDVQKLAFLLYSCRESSTIRLCLHYTGQLIMSTWKLLGLVWNRNGPELEQVVHTVQQSVPEGLAEEDLVLKKILFVIFFTIS